MPVVDAPVSDSQSKAPSGEMTVMGYTVRTATSRISCSRRLRLSGLQMAWSSAMHSSRRSIGRNTTLSKQAVRVSPGTIAKPMPALTRDRMACECVICCTMRGDLLHDARGDPGFGQ
jgi:hypothetical protein